MSALYFVKLPDGRRWKVRQAVSLSAALVAIAHARVTGSIGHTDLMSRWPDPTEHVIADVIQINSDGTERQPYQEAY